MPGFAIINADDIVGGVPVDGATMIYRSAATFEGAAVPSHAAALSSISPLFTPNLYINDTFDYPDNTVLSGLEDYEEVYTSAAEATNTIRVFGGEARLNTQYTRSQGIRATKVLPVNHFCEVDVTSLSAANFAYPLQVRLANGTTFYGIRLMANLSISLRKMINGVETSLTTVPAAALENMTTGTWRLEAEGTSPTTLRLYKDGFLLRTATDSSPELVSGGAGFRLAANGSYVDSVRLSRFQCGAV